MSGERGAANQEPDQYPGLESFRLQPASKSSDAQGPEPEATIAAGYRARLQLLSSAASSAREGVNRLANLRLLAFALAVALAAIAAWRWTFWPLIGSAILIIVFGALIRRHGAARRELRQTIGLTGIIGEDLARLDRDWNHIPPRHPVAPESGHPHAFDLDIFGFGSLFHLLDTPRTPAGVDALVNWLSGPAPVETIRARQAAVSELAASQDYREALLLQARELPDEPPDVAAFLDWAEREPELSSRRALIWLARISPVLLMLSIVAEATGFIALPLWPIFLGVNIVVLWLAGRSASAELEPVARLGNAATRQYADLLDRAASIAPTSPRLRQLAEEIGGSDRTAAEALRSLERRTRLVLPPDAWANIILQIVALWDIHLLSMLEGWQRSYGSNVRGWFAALGEIEALVALSGLAHNHPGWTMPQVDRTVDRFRAEGLGHPLIPPRLRVDNDVEVGPAGTLLLVTGSNMSGKSTLLRAIGVNAVLAQAGGPVCAKDLSLAPVDVWTSMRVEDSLNQGVSYFMAELQRLKLVVDAATAEPKARPVLYLLDEILHGTNPAERQIAARRVIRRLVSTSSIGAVSTHDLELIDDPLLAERARLVHFRESIDDHDSHPTMSFDFKLRPGLATSRNALRLLELIGLGEPGGCHPDAANPDNEQLSNTDPNS
ncbi:MAG TPA: hypothetical protein VKU87_01230 [Thermomicrobiaceae bacterium]|nr:hypothetical protein [Thermomicrobiaceae bacterium]